MGDIQKKIFMVEEVRYVIMLLTKNVVHFMIKLKIKKMKKILLIIRI